jgi:hypothetical protein
LTATIAREVGVLGAVDLAHAAAGDPLGFVASELTRHPTACPAQRKRVACPGELEGSVKKP